MYKKLFTASLVGLMCFQAAAQTLKVPAPSPLQTVTQAFALGEIKIEYSRPSVKGRVIFGDLVPYGKIWRTGANASTKITLSDDLNIGGSDVKAGTYALYSIPNQNEWDVMLYSDLSLGGNTADYDNSKETARFKIKPAVLGDKVETFTIAINNITPTTCSIDLMWDKTQISIPVKAEIDSRIMKQIDEVMGDSKKPYFSAANYYFENDKDLNKAAEWCMKAVELNPKAFWVSHLMAKIKMKQKNYAEAIRYAEMSRTEATAQKSDDYIKMNDKLIAEARSATGVKNKVGIC
jgi:hypothetical protein